MTAATPSAAIISLISKRRIALRITVSLDHSIYIRRHCRKAVGPLLANLINCGPGLNAVTKKVDVPHRREEEMGEERDQQLERKTK